MLWLCQAFLLLTVHEVEKVKVSRKSMNDTLCVYEADPLDASKEIIEPLGTTAGRVRRD